MTWGRGHMLGWHVATENWPTGRKFRALLLERNKGVLERVFEDGGRFVSLRQMGANGRLMLCPCGTSLALHVWIETPPLPRDATEEELARDARALLAMGPRRYCGTATATRVPGGWSISEGALPQNNPCYPC